MKSGHSAVKLITRVVTAFLLTVCFAFLLISAEKTYSTKSAEETEILSLVLKAEIHSSSWAKNETICFSVERMDPSSNLVKALQQRDLNVRSSAEWAKKFNCGFEVRLEYTKFDLTRRVEVRSQVVDLREINKGEGDLALLQRDGQYLLIKTNGKWSISGYIPNKQGASTQNSGKSCNPTNGFSCFTCAVSTLVTA